MKKWSLLLAVLLLLGCFAPAQAAWSDVWPEEWYADAAEFCVKKGLMREYAGQFRPDEPALKGDVVNALAKACDRLQGGRGSASAPDNWGVAVIRSDRGIPLLTFRAWETDTWRAWTGLTGRDGYHYLIAATEEQLLTIFPDATGYDAFYEAELDLGDRVLTGRLYGFLNGSSDFADPSGPVFAFYPAGERTEADGPNPYAPTALFIGALPEGAADRDLTYTLLKAGVVFETLTEESAKEAASRWDLAWLLYQLTLSDALPEGSFAPIFDRHTTEAETDYAAYLDPLFQAGLILGVDEEGNYAPNETLTRAQLSAVLYRLLNPEQRGIAVFLPVPTAAPAAAPKTEEAANLPAEPSESPVEASEPPAEQPESPTEA